MRQTTDERQPERNERDAAQSERSEEQAGRERELQDQVRMGDEAPSGTFRIPRV